MNGSERPPILGIDVGGTKCAIVVATRGGETVDRSEFPSHARRGFGAMFDELSAYVAAALTRHPEVDRIGVSIGGPLDAASGTILGPPHLPGWDGVPLKRLLEDRFGRVAHVEHDAKAGALAEWIFGAGRGADDLVFLTLGTGLGAGVIAGGRLLTGRAGLAGEVGHWRMASGGPVSYGKAGSWEAFASGTGLAALAHYRFPGTFAVGVTAQDVNERARQGSEEAREVILESGRRLGAGLALLVDLLAPELIVLGSLAARLGEVYVATARETMLREALPAHADCRVTCAELGDRIGDVAPVATVVYREEA